MGTDVRKALGEGAGARASEDRRRGRSRGPSGDPTRRGGYESHCIRALGVTGGPRRKRRRRLGPHVTVTCTTAEELGRHVSGPLCWPPRAHWPGRVSGKRGCHGHERRTFQKQTGHLWPRCPHSPGTEVLAPCSVRAPGVSSSVTARPAWVGGARAQLSPVPSGAGQWGPGLSPGSRFRKEGAAELPAAVLRGSRGRASSAPLPRAAGVALPSGSFSQGSGSPALSPR